MLTLSNILKINALSSGSTGLLLVIFSKFSANLFAVSLEIPFISTGIFLIVFSVFVAYQAYQTPLNAKDIVFIIWIDRLWVIASLVVVVLVYGSISTVGVIIIIAIAAWVGLMAYLQKSKLIRV